MYYIAEGMATEESYSKAVSEATEWCLTSLRSQLCSNVKVEYVDGEVVSASFTTPAGFKLAPEIPLLTMYRPKDGKVEVAVIYAFDRKLCVVTQ